MERAIAGLDGRIICLAGEGALAGRRLTRRDPGSCDGVSGGQGCEGIERRAGVGMGIEGVPALDADAAPLAQQQSAAEQVGPDLHAVSGTRCARGERGSVKRLPLRAAAGRGQGVQGRICGVWAWSRRNCVAGGQFGAAKS